MDKNELKTEIEQHIENLRVLKETFELNMHIHKVAGEYNKEINRINAFVNIVLVSTQETFIMEINKLLDVGSEKNIVKLLNVCETNYKLFPTERVTKFVDDDGKEDSFIDKIDIRKDISNIRTELLKHKNTIENLKGLRDQFYAHADKDFLLNPSKAFSNYNVTYDDIEALINLLLKSLNKIHTDLCNESFWIMNKSNEQFEMILKKLKMN